MFFVLFYVVHKISNFSMWTTKHLTQASCTELTLIVSIPNHSLIHRKTISSDCSIVYFIATFQSQHFENLIKSRLIMLNLFANLRAIFEMQLFFAKLMQKLCEHCPNARKSFSYNKTISYKIQNLKILSYDGVVMLKNSLQTRTSVVFSK